MYRFRDKVRYVLISHLKTVRNRDKQMREIKQNEQALENEKETPSLQKEALEINYDNINTCSVEEPTGNELSKLPFWCFLFVLDKEDRKTFFFPYRNLDTKINKSLLLKVRKILTSSSFHESSSPQSLKNLVKFNPKMKSYIKKVCNTAWPGLPEVNIDDSFTLAERFDSFIRKSYPQYHYSNSFGCVGIDAVLGTEDLLQESNIIIEKTKEANSNDSDAEEEEIRKEQERLLKLEKKRIARRKKKMQKRLDVAKKAESLFGNIEKKKKKPKEQRAFPSASRKKNSARDKMRALLFNDIIHTQRERVMAEPTLITDTLDKAEEIVREDESFNESLQGDIESEKHASDNESIAESSIDSEEVSEDEDEEVNQANNKFRQLVQQENKIAKDMLKRKKNGIFEEEASENEDDEDEEGDIGNYGLGKQKSGENEATETDLWAEKVRNKDLEGIVDEVNEKEDQIESNKNFHLQQVAKDELEGLARLSSDLKNGKILSRRRRKIRQSSGTVGFLDDISDSESSDEEVELAKKMRYQRLDESRKERILNDETIVDNEEERQKLEEIEKEIKEQQDFLEFSKATKLDWEKRRPVLESSEDFIAETETFQMAKKISQGNINKRVFSIDKRFAQFNSSTVEDKPLELCGIQQSKGYVFEAEQVSFQENSDDEVDQRYKRDYKKLRRKEEDQLRSRVKNSARLLSVLNM
eukprot:maker-scaffold_35-snap-gene-2.99-mRNA-1 protein AED:0.00 eAED:0.00 QI:21/1/1/1/1/1/3/19/698